MPRTLRIRCLAIGFRRSLVRLGDKCRSRPPGTRLKRKPAILVTRWQPKPLFNADVVR
jgi:hypothetical protein